MFKFVKKISMFMFLVMCMGVMTSCFGGGSKKVSNSTDELYEKAVAGIELPQMQKLNSSDLEGLIKIKSSDVEEATVNISVMNVKATEIGIFKFSNSDQEKAIDKGIKERLSDLEETWSRYLPDQYDLVKNVKKFTYGNVKGYVIADESAKIISNIEKALK